MGVFLAICVRAFELRSRFGVAAGAATRALRYARFSATAPLRDCDRRLRTIMVGARCEGFLQRLTSAHPQEKEKARSDERA